MTRIQFRQISKPAFVPELAGEIRWDGYCFGCGCGAHNGCGGASENTDTRKPSLVAIKINGVWYFQITGTPVCPSSTLNYGCELFYAEASDISSPIPNALTAFSSSCSPYSRSSVFMDVWNGLCTTGSGDSNFLAVGAGGSLSFSYTPP